MTMQKPGYPNLSVKLYEDFEAWQEESDRFVELFASVTTLTMRDGLHGINEGILQFYDGKNMHTRLNGQQIIQISVSNANSEEVINRIYGCKHSSVSIDEKGDNIIAINLAPVWQVENIKFARSFFANATESVQTMIDSIYGERKAIAPSVEGLNIYVPRVAWVNNLEMYMDYVREVGLAVESETHAFVWEDIRGIHLTDYKTIVDQPAKNMVVGDPNQIGDFISHMAETLVYDFVWDAKTNQHVRSPMENVTIYSHSFNDKGIKRLSVGSGENSIMVSRSGGYSEMTYRNGYEEAFRLATMAQYDGYASCKMLGNFKMTPGTKLNFGDKKDQLRTDFYVDEVVHVITQNFSETHLYMFTHGKDLVPVELEKIKNEIETMTPPSDSVEPEAVGDAKGAQWDLDKLATTVTALAAGRKSTGKCALFVRKALEASQLKPQFSGGLGNANEMPPKLVQYGWIAIGQNVTNWKKGDISVFMRTNTELGSKYGHIAIFNGSQWVSDFIQGSIQPNRKDNLTYTIYRARYGYARGI